MFEERGKIRKKLLEDHVELSIIDKVKMIANDQKFPPEYYPIEWIKLSIDEIENLPIDIIKKLQ